MNNYAAGSKTRPPKLDTDAERQSDSTIEVAPSVETPLRTIEWIGDLNGCVRMIDQTLLPVELKWIECHTPEEMWEAIRSLRVRGAPAIGIAAAMGLALAVRHAPEDVEGFWDHFRRAKEYLATARPTAVNLFWALDQMHKTAKLHESASVADIKQALLQHAVRIRDEDAAQCQSIGRHGASLIPEGAGVLTHCNAGGLATAEYGTALAVMYMAHQQGRRFNVYADETRPLLQGSRLTAWELNRAGIDVTVICDGMAASLMRSGKIQCVITGADRIAANGDTANKIGTYSIAALAKFHEIPFYVAAPMNTFDPDCTDGAMILIEQRNEDEIRCGMGRKTVPDKVAVYNPAFDITPAGLIDAIITDKGVIQPVGKDQIRRFLQM